MTVGAFEIFAISEMVPVTRIPTIPVTSGAGRERMGGGAVHTKHDTVCPYRTLYIPIYSSISASQTFEHGASLAEMPGNLNEGKGDGRGLYIPERRVQHAGILWLLGDSKVV